MIKLTIDDKQVECAEDTTVLQAAESLGIHIPRFCYHKRLSIAGNCRMCLVEIEGAKNPVISCKEIVRDGMIVKTNTDLIKRARADVLEFILLNHPIDCPICDQSGECDLQDLYFEHSLRPSRLMDAKVHKPKVQDIGPYIVLDAERCVECTRCVRFCEEVAGVHEIGLFERGDHSTIGVLEGRRLENPYSLCTVDLCPVGALTSKDFRFKKRVWFLKSTPSICLGCATGCNIWIDHCDSIVYRFRPRKNDSVNKSWLCDEGRKTFMDLRQENRLIEPHALQGCELKPCSWDDAVARISSLLHDGNAVEIVGVLSALSSIEENEAFSEMCRSVFGSSRLAWSGRPVDSKFGDKILRDADRNPNAAGVRTIAQGQLTDLKRGAAYVALGDLSGDDLLRLVESQPAWVILITTRLPKCGGRWADAMLPKATYAETGGSFTNRQGTKQVAAKAFNPIGNSLSIDDMSHKLKAAIKGKML